MTKTKIASLRKQRGWTQERLAEESQVNPRTIQRLESGEDASLETLRLVANALGVQIGDLFESIDNTDKAKEIIDLDSKKVTQTRKWLAIRDLYRTVIYTIFVILMIILLSGVSMFNDNTWEGLVGVIFWIILWPIGISVIKMVQVSWLEPYLSRKYPKAESLNLAYNNHNSDGSLTYEKHHSRLWIVGLIFIVLVVAGIGGGIFFLYLLKIVL